MKALLMPLGAALMIGAYYVFDYAMALGCAMNTTGCAGYTLDFFRDEAIVFWLPFAVGVLLFAAGLVGYLRRR